MLSLRSDHKKDDKQPSHLTGKKSESYTFNDFILAIEKIVMPHRDPTPDLQAYEEHRLIRSAFVFIIDWLLEKAGINPIETSRSLLFNSLFSAQPLQDDHSILIIFLEKKNEINALVNFLNTHHPEFNAQLLTIDALPFIRINPEAHHRVQRNDRDFRAAHAQFPMLALEEQIVRFEHDDDQHGGRDRIFYLYQYKVLKIKIAPLFQHHLLTYLDEYAKRCFSVTNYIAAKKLREIYPETRIPIIFQQLIHHLIKYKAQRLKTTSKELTLFPREVSGIVNHYLAQDTIFNVEYSTLTYFTEHGQYSYQLQARQNYDPILTAIKNYFNAILPLSCREYENGVLIDATVLAHPCFHTDIQELFEHNSQLLYSFFAIKQFETTIYHLRQARDTINHDDDLSAAMGPYTCFTGTRLDKDHPRFNSKITIALTELIDKFLKNIYENGINKIGQLSNIIDSIEKINKNLNWTSHKNIISSLFKYGRPNYLLRMIKYSLSESIDAFRKELPITYLRLHISDTKQITATRSSR